MYCPSCGERSEKGRNYCKICGTRINTEGETSTGHILEHLLTALCLTVIVGLGILVGLVAVLLKSGIPDGLLGLIVIAHLGTIFGISFFLLKQIKRVLDARLGSGKSGHEEYNSPEQLFSPPNPTKRLQEPADYGVASVVEDTTRTLDKVRRDQT